MAILEATDIIKRYKRAGYTVTALNRASIKVEEGEFVAITGVSGSKKSTFINICTELDTANAGSVILGGKIITAMKDGEFTQYREKKQMTYALVDCRMREAEKKALHSYADKVISLPPLSSLPTPVASHPDMLLFSYAKNIFTWQSYAKEQAEIFSELEGAGYKVVTIDEIPSDKYPYDVPLNCAVVGEYLIANTKTMSKKAKSFAENAHLKIIHTNQGYAKCSTCVVSDNAIITSDTSIHALAKKNGISSLLVSSDGVRLDGYDKGFIGGASGSDGQNVFFCGDLTKHPDGKRIVAFCEQHGKKAVSLSREPLYDYGTVIFLKI
ncbi:MAG: ATP-binding cassette domain-containing protein [Ruminococcaceae bacterium]|nr:ATP-binding cassette domain-containing protein [Oscillospiraceae bacterium]